MEISVGTFLLLLLFAFVCEFIDCSLGMIGVTFGLIVARSYFGFMTFLGVISLAGIVINNAIVLLDRIKFEIEENGLDPRQARVTFKGYK